MLFGRQGDLRGESLTGFYLELYLTAFLFFLVASPTLRTLILEPYD